MATTTSVPTDDNTERGDTEQTTFICRYLLIDLITVSYTHLDVYKRQSLTSTGFCLQGGGKKKKNLLEELPTSSMVYHQCPSTHAFAAIQPTTISFLPTRNGCTMFYEESYALAVLFPYPLSYTCLLYTSIWEGPYTVKKRINDVVYRINRKGSESSRSST